MELICVWHADDNGECTEPSPTHQIPKRISSRRVGICARRSRNRSRYFRLQNRGAVIQALPAAS